MAGSNIDLPENAACAFCSYLRGDRPYTILERNEQTATLVTREQRGRPHLLVIPIMHRPTILDLRDDEAAALMLATRDAAKMIDRTYGPPGIAVWQNNGISANQSVSHVHFHVAGTLPGGGTNRGKVREIAVRDTDEIARLLRQEKRLVF